MIDLDVNYRPKTYKRRPYLLICDRLESPLIEKILKAIGAEFKYIDSYGTWSRDDKNRYEVDEKGYNFLKRWWL